MTGPATAAGPARPERRSAAERRALVQAAGLRLADASADEVLAWAASEFGLAMAVACSMADAVLPHLVSRFVPGVDVLFLDTGYHFAETIGTVDAVAATYPVRMLTIRPKQNLAEHEAARGVLHRTDSDACCALRKVAPLDDALRGYRAWATGLRRDDSPDRADTPTVRWDPKRGLLKLAPIAAWTDDDVEAYVAEHPGVILNPLLQEGYRSIGCAPCTRAVADGEDARAGRWSGLAKTECGIHV